MMKLIGLALTTCLFVPILCNAYRKLDLEGNYAPFPGTTVVSSYDASLDSKFQKFMEALKTSQLVSSKCALLPYQSLHMTTINLDVAADMSFDDWVSMVNWRMPTYRKLVEDLEANALSTKVQVERVEVSGVIQLALKVPTSDVTKILSIAKTHGFQRRVPFPFHMTLCYMTKSRGAETDADLIKEVEDALTTGFGRKDPRFKMSPQRLRYFNDMTAFPEFDATYNPFTEKQPDTEKKPGGVKSKIKSVVRKTKEALGLN